jgi:Fe-S-cluster containining protein
MLLVRVIGILKVLSEMADLACRPNCAACCIAPSISSPIVGMPNGKPAGVPCIALDEQMRCRLFGDERRPLVCASLKPSIEMCGDEHQGREYAITYLTHLEQVTS